MRGVSDYKVLSYADKVGRVIATIDEFDFEKLLVKRNHNGVVAIPAGGTRDEQFNYIMAGIKYLRQGPSAVALVRDSIITVNEQLRISRRVVCSPSLAPTLALVTKTSIKIDPIRKRVRLLTRFNGLHSRR
jgi:hypothetical protein